jgi:orotidine-5'-phosphate decarboxylase
MNERSAFVRAWHAWRHTPLPVDEFRGGRAGAPAYDVQLVLDHLAGSIYSSGAAAMEGRAWDFGAICERHRESLREADGLLETLPADAREPYRAWIDHSRALLDALAAWQDANGQPSEPRVMRPIPVIALDVPTRAEAESLLDRLGPGADFVKVGLQLFTAEGPDVVRAMHGRGCRVFLDLKLHDIPNTVAHAVQSAARLGVELLTVHASGGAAMLRAAADARGAEGLKLLGVTVLTSLSGAEVAEAWGRDAVSAEDEVARLARLAEGAGLDGVVASVAELPVIRAATGEGFRVLTPGIRLAGDAAGDQSRVATPGVAARRGADYVVLGRSVTAAADPAAALRRAIRELDEAAIEPIAG